MANDGNWTVTKKFTAITRSVERKETKRSHLAPSSVRTAVAKLILKQCFQFTFLWNNACFKKCFQVLTCFVLQSGLKTVFNPVEICERRITWTFCAQTSDPVPMQMATRSKEIFRCSAQKVQTCTG